MSKSYKEQRQNKEQDFIDQKPKHAYKSNKNRKEKFIHNALRSRNLIDLIKYSEEDWYANILIPRQRNTGGIR